MTRKTVKKFIFACTLFIGVALAQESQKSPIVKTSDRTVQNKLKWAALGLQLHSCGTLTFHMCKSSPFKTAKDIVCNAAYFASFLPGICETYLSAKNQKKNEGTWDNENPITPMQRVRHCSEGIVKGAFVPWQVLVAFTQYKWAQEAYENCKNSLSDGINNYKEMNTLLAAATGIPTILFGAYKTSVSSWNSLKKAFTQNRDNQKGLS